MKTHAKLAALVGLALSLVALPAFAAPDLGPSWKLVGQNKVRYFVKDKEALSNTSRSLLASDVAGNQTEATGHSTKRNRKDGKARTDVSFDERKADRSTTSQSAGSSINTFSHQKFVTYKIETRVQPYSLSDVTSWQERTKTTSKNTYNDRTTVSWTDPFTNAQLTAITESRVGPLTEYSYSAWANRSADPVPAGTGEDILGQTSTAVSNRTETTRVASYHGHAAQSATGARGESAVFFAEGSSVGSAGGRSASLGATMRLAGADKAKAQGKSKLDFDALFEAGQAGQTLYLNDRAAFKLGTAGQNVVFYPIDASGNVRAEFVTLAPGALDASSSKAEIQIRGVVPKGQGGLELAGKFRQAYLDKAGKGHVLTTL